MTGLVLAVHLDGAAAEPDLRAMVAAGARRGRSGVREARVLDAAAAYLDGAEEDASALGRPHASDASGVLLLADARIDNRDDVASALGCDSLARRRDDGAIVLAAYERWGEAFAEHLRGDFAVAIWDGLARRLVLARDTMAMRPLFYRVEAQRLLVASEVKQILAAPSVPHAPSERMLVSRLAGMTPLAGWTFYEGVRRVPPGVTLVVDGGTRRLRRHWRPTRTLPRTARSTEEHAEALRQTLGEAVRDRLQAATAPGLLLSGGLDSTSIAGLAGRLREQDGAALPVLQTISFAHDELTEADERDVSDQVVTRYGLPNLHLPADAAWPLAGYPEHGPDLDAPDRFRSHVLQHAAVDAARRQGITVLMTGQRGDSMVGDQIVDYVARLLDPGPLAVWRDLRAHSAGTGESLGLVANRYLLRRIPAAVWPPERASELRTRLRRFAGREAQGVAPWVSRDALVRLGLFEAARRAAPASDLRQEARRRRHRAILDDSVARNAEALERQYAASGVRYADPWADLRLADLVLAMRQHELTPGGESKALVRKAMRGVLPEEARLAARKASPAALYDRGILERAQPVVRSLIEGSRLARAGYVDEAELRASYERQLAGDSRVSNAERALFWRYLDAEDWMRRYHD